MELDTVEIEIHGIVQGVGFRPNVFRLAKRYGIVGTVKNTGEGVIIQAQGRNDKLRAFEKAVQGEAPPLARITEFITRPLAHRLECTSFSIDSSRSGSEKTALVSPDVSLCVDCLRELLDPSDRRYLYPFINCTNCGPRYSIIRSIPYDRPSTSMRPFVMCSSCDREYHDPMDRRFHAQPNACWECGPRLFWHDARGEEIPVEDPIEHAVEALAQGKVVAMKGLGGFHLAVDACSDQAVALLRERKGRPHKPLAIMVKDLEAAGRFACLGELEKELLTSRERPIVLLQKRRGSGLSEGIAPNIAQVGIMLPYTPVHHLLFHHRDCPDALVMTSGNLSGYPLCKDNHEAVEKLKGIADYFLFYNRDIVTRVDDSVAMVVAGRPRLIRRSRGLTPSPVQLPWQLPEVLACGPELKNTFCISRGKEAFLSQHIGDMQGIENLDFFEKTVEHLKALLEVQPEVVACDLHPDYLTTRYARKLPLPLVQVQHHLAHAAAVMAEHGVDRPAIALVLDGTGYGLDGTVWGGEILLVDPGNWNLRRLARLRPMPLPGGDAAAREPWRMALSALWTAFGLCGLGEGNLPSSLLEIEESRREVLSQMIKTGVNTPMTSSCGRLFDAVAALLGVRFYATYEAQAAMEIVTLALEACSGDNDLETSGLEARLLQVPGSPDLLELDWTPLVREIVGGLGKGVPPSLIALGFHQQLVGLLCTGVWHFCQTSGIKTVVLGGGCMQNPLLLEGLIREFTRLGLEVHSAETIPANDGGISLGQAVIGGSTPCV